MWLCNAPGGPTVDETVASGCPPAGTLVQPSRDLQDATAGDTGERVRGSLCIIS